MKCKAEVNGKTGRLGCYINFTALRLTAVLEQTPPSTLFGSSLDMCLALEA